MMKKQLLAAFALGALFAAPLVFADEQPAKAGFYGGVALRDAGAEAAGVYRWANDLAVEGSLSSAASYALRPFDASTRRGVGLSLTGSPDVATHTWNANVFTSWSFRNRFSLYGRLGYAQSESVPAYALASLPPSDPRRLRDGVNYGVGVRYDITPALGLRLEYARFPRFAGEAVTGPLPDSDQVQFGMQFRF